MCLAERCLAVVLAIALALVPACAGRSGPGGATNTSEPSQTVVRTLRGYASYYGRAFAGRPTASGEVFDPSDMVAAHRTLPFGTRVRVTNVANGRSVILRVIDRGPYAARSTIIDVSSAAASKLGFMSKGRTRVTVEVLGDER